MTVTKKRLVAKRSKKGKVLMLDGIPVRDGKFNIDLKITPSDIKKATKADPRNCAAAVTCRRVEHSSDVYVSRSAAYVLRDGYYDRYMVPQSLRAQLAVIDQNGDFHPTVYQLKAPKGQRRLGHATRGKDKKKRKSPRAPRHFVGISALMRPSLR